MLNAATREHLGALIERAARRSLGIRTANESLYGWELYSPFRVVCHGSLDNIDSWLTVGESRDR